jgi:cytosine/adenosine deaminase-related metal-dependent hydrolase
MTSVRIAGGTLVDGERVRRATAAAERAALAIRGATLVTVDPGRSILARDVLVDAGGRICGLVEPGTHVRGARSIEATGQVVVPGLVQAHLHLCQTLFRGLAEDRPLLKWLEQRIWPLEAAHDPESLRASARLGIAELLLGGTTAVLDMGTVHHTDALFEAAAETGIRYTGGKALMDAGENVPRGLLETTAVALRDGDRLANCWHEREGGRLRYAYCPRFALTATIDLLRSVGARARANAMLVHTHASEQRDEASAVRERFGSTNIELLANLGLGDSNACLAHCVWPEPHELDVLASGGATVVHCPSCNLKLGSGAAPIAEYLERGVNVALGADGAASNNRVDGWEELRLAGLIAAFRNGPGAVTAAELFEAATLGGARALGLDTDIGSIEIGKFADLTILDLRRPHAVGPDDVYTQLVYSARATDVRTVLVGGRVLVQDGRLTGFSEADVVADAQVQRARLLERVGQLAD